MVASIIKRKFRICLQKSICIAIIVAILLYAYTFVNLEFCYKLLSHNIRKDMCNKYKNKEYSGSLCEELCCDTSNDFRNFKCSTTERKTVMFTTEKNDDIYSIKAAKDISNDLSWTNAEGQQIYPRINIFHNIVKMHITITYNITLDDTMIRALVNQEIDKDNPKQMLNFYRLFRDNNYMMSKLYDEESIFPTILGSCGPYYAAETLKIVYPSNSLMTFVSIELRERLKLAINIMEYLFRLDEMKPEPLKMCKMSLNMFGRTEDKRIKYQSAAFTYGETKVDKLIGNGDRCHTDTDCDWQECMGKCDTKQRICNNIQQNNNMQIFCKNILKGNSDIYSGLLEMHRSRSTISKLIDDCINPSSASFQLQSITGIAPARAYAPSTELILRLYNEMKSLYKEVSMKHDQQQQNDVN